MYIAFNHNLLIIRSSISSSVGLIQSFSRFVDKKSRGSSVDP